MTKRSLLRGIWLAVLFTAVAAGPGCPQEGKTLFGANQQETLKAMKEIAKSLGLKCQDCHQKEGGKLNYKADTARKRVARQMKRSMVDSLAQKGSAEILLKEGHHNSKISALYRAQGDSAGIHLTVALEGKTYQKTVPLPAENQPIFCMTCHNGQLEFLTGPAEHRH